VSEAVERLERFELASFYMSEKEGGSIQSAIGRKIMSKRGRAGSIAKKARPGPGSTTSISAHDVFGYQSVSSRRAISAWEIRLAVPAAHFNVLRILKTSK